MRCATFTLAITPQWVSGITLVLFAASWVPIAWLPHSLIVLIIGIVVLNLAGQAIHVTNQHLIVEIDPTASGRLIGSYMVYYAIGTGGGAIAATSAYSTWGWGAVCVLGAGLSALALLIWVADRIFSREEPGAAPSPMGTPIYLAEPSGRRPIAPTG